MFPISTIFSMLSLITYVIIRKCLYRSKQGLLCWCISTKSKHIFFFEVFYFVSWPNWVQHSIMRHSYALQIGHQLLNQAFTPDYRPVIGYYSLTIWDCSILIKSSPIIDSFNAIFSVTLDGHSLWYLLLFASHFITTYQWFTMKYLIFFCAMLLVADLQANGINMDH